MINTSAHRPLERRILRLLDEGVSDVEIAQRFRRSPDMVRRIVAYAGLPRSERAADRPVDVLRPLERRVIRWRDSASSLTAIGARFHRSAAHIALVETWARHKLARAESDAGPSAS